MRRTLLILLLAPQATTADTALKFPGGGDTVHRIVVLQNEAAYVDQADKATRSITTLRRDPKVPIGRIKSITLFSKCEYQQRLTANARALYYARYRMDRSDFPLGCDARDIKRIPPSAVTTCPENIISTCVDDTHPDAPLLDKNYVRTAPIGAAMWRRLTKRSFLHNERFHWDIRAVDDERLDLYIFDDNTLQRWRLDAKGPADPFAAGQWRKAETFDFYLEKDFLISLDGRFLFVPEKDNLTIMGPIDQGPKTVAKIPLPDTKLHTCVVDNVVSGQSFILIADTLYDVAGKPVTKIPETDYHKRYQATAKYIWSQIDKAK